MKRLKDDNGEWIEEESALKDLAEDYFSHLFNSEVQVPNPEVIAKVQPRVTQQINDALTVEYTREEVKKALFNIGDLKAPGPDGLHGIFYKKFWYVIGEDLTNEVLLALNSRSIPDSWNDTTIVLILKVKNPEHIS